MSVLLDWIIAIVMLGSFGFISYLYYRRQMKKYRGGKHNEAMDKFRGGDGGCCH